MLSLESLKKQELMFREYLVDGKTVIPVASGPCISCKKCIFKNIRFCFDSHITDDLGTVFPDCMLDYAQPVYYDFKL